MPEKSHHHMVEINLAAPPVDIGGALVSDTFNPLMHHIEARFETPEQRAQYWAGAMAAFAGAMTASIGADAATAILDSIKPLALLVCAEAARGAH